MGLTKCKVCGGKVSDNAESCPHCGEPKPQKKSGGNIWLLILVVAILVVISIYTRDSEDSQATNIKESQVTNSAVNQVVEETRTPTRTNKLLITLSKTPENDYKKRYHIYKELSKWNPVNKDYKDKINYYAELAGISIQRKKGIKKKQIVDAVPINKSTCINSGNRWSWNGKANRWDCLYPSGERLNQISKVDLKSDKKNKKYSEITDTEERIKYLRREYSPGSTSRSNMQICQNKLKRGNNWFYKGDYNEALYYFKDAPTYCEGTPLERAAYTHIDDVMQKGGYSQ